MVIRRFQDPVYTISKKSIYYHHHRTNVMESWFTRRLVIWSEVRRKRKASRISSSSHHYWSTKDTAQSLVYYSINDTIVNSLYHQNGINRPCYCLLYKLKFILIVHNALVIICGLCIGLIIHHSTKYPLISVRIKSFVTDFGRYVSEWNEEVVPWGGLIDNSL